MKTFYVYKHPVLGYQAVKLGFGWPAFFFSAIWAFVKKMWGIGFALLGVYIIFVFLESVFMGQDSLFGYFLICFGELLFCIFVGAQGNNWRCRSLENRGFEKIKTVQAETPDGAVASIFQSNDRQHEHWKISIKDHSNY